MNLMLYLRIRRIQTKNTEYKNERLRLLENVKKCYDGRGMIINPFKIEVFPFYRDSEDESSRTMVIMILEIIMVSSIMKSLIDQLI